MNYREKKEVATLIREISSLIREIIRQEINGPEAKNPVDQIKVATKEQAPNSEYLSISQAAIISGYSRKTIYNLTWEGKIRAYKTAKRGNMLFIKRSDLQKYIERHIA